MDNAKDIIRLTTMSRDDMHVKNILGKAASTALYTYKEENSEWTKDNVEGSLIIYEREAPPHNMMKIVNRLNKHNFIEPLTSACEIQVKPPYLLFKNAKGCIYGIWFNEQMDVHRISSVIKAKIESSTDSTPQPAPNILSDPAVAAAGNTNGDIMTMLSLAHGEFESKRLEPTHVHSSISSANPDLIKPSPLRSADGGSTNVVADFFAKVGGGSSSSNAPPSSNITSSVSPTANPVLQKLFQAAIGGQASVVSVSGGGVSAPIPISRPIGHSHNAPHSGSGPGAAPMSLQELEGKLKENLHINSLRTDESQLPQNTNVNKKANNLDGPSLLSPQVFTCSKEKDSNESVDAFSSLTTGRNFGVDAKPVNDSQESLHDGKLLMSPGNITPLTQEQLVQAFSILLKKDDFVHQLHEAYIKALHESLKGCI